MLEKRGTPADNSRGAEGSVALPTFGGASVSLIAPQIAFQMHLQKHPHRGWDEWQGLPGQGQSAMHQSAAGP